MKGEFKELANPRRTCVEQACAHLAGGFCTKPGVGRNRPYELNLMDDTTDQRCFKPKEEGAHEDSRTREESLRAQGL